MLYFISMLKIFVLIFLSIMSNLLAVEDYDIYPLGAKGNSLGGGFVAVANDISAFYWNVAGLVLQTNISFVYLFDSQFLLSDPRQTLNSDFKISYEVPPLVGFVLPLKNKKNSVFGFSVSSPVQRKFGYGTSGFYMIQFAPSFAFVPYKDLAFGFKPAFLTSNNNWGIGWDLELGIIKKFSDLFRTGIVFKSPVFFKWQREYLQTPWILQTGCAFSLNRNYFFTFDIEYQNWLSALWIKDQIKENYKGKTGLFKTILPHAGFSFIEEKYGAQVRVGLSGSSELDGKKLVSRYLLSLGIGARAAKNLHIDACIVDALLFSFLFPQRPLETLQILIEYRI